MSESNDCLALSISIKRLTLSISVVETCVGTVKNKKKKKIYKITEIKYLPGKIKLSYNHLK